MDNLISIGIYVGIAAVVLLSIFITMTMLYKRASKEISFVRTGVGGEKVVMNGGALVLPVFHEIMPVNMKTLVLTVARSNNDALITLDRLRIDVRAEFYVRVAPNAEAISMAAQTLGERTMNPAQLKELVEGKFVDALRSVAAGMTMEQLHEQRADFVQKVQAVSANDLAMNGLELESVSLTGLDQTSIEFFNADNAFDAEGLKKLTEQIELRKRERNDIEQDTRVQIESKNLQAEQESLKIKRDDEFARLEQAREVALRRAQQASEIAAEQAAREKEAETARIAAQRETEAAQIEASRAIETERIEASRQVDSQKIEADRQIEEARINQQRALEIARQEQQIAVQNKSREESQAKAEADAARALAITAEEQVNTARESEIAERQKKIELIEAAKVAEREAIKHKVEAEAQRQVEADLAEAARAKAQGEADAAKLNAAGRAEAARLEASGKAEAYRLNATAEADAVRAMAEADEIRYRVEAEGKLAINEAENKLSDAQIAMQIKLETIRTLPGLVAETAKPLEAIDSIKIVQVSGLPGTGNSVGTGGAGNASSGNLAKDAVDAALSYRTQLPILNGLMKEIGLDGSSFDDMAAGALPKTAEKAEEPAK